MSIESIKKALEKVYIGEWYVSGVKTNGLSVVYNAADISMFGITADTFEAEYIVAVNPAVISELLSDIESLQCENAVLKQDRSTPVTGLNPLDAGENATGKTPAQYFAEKAYEVADAMIAARKAGA